jgi:hypothetical protein
MRGRGAPRLRAYTRFARAIYYGQHVITIPVDFITHVYDDEEKIHIGCDHGEVDIWKEI